MQVDEAFAFGQDCHVICQRLRSRLPALRGHKIGSGLRLGAESHHPPGLLCQARDHPALPAQSPSQRRKKEKVSPMDLPARRPKAAGMCPQARSSGMQMSLRR